jgi:hypothetical protein
VAAEPEGIAHGVLNGPVDRLPECKLEVPHNFRIGLSGVDGGRHDILLHSLQAMASMAPAAPSKCPVMLLVALDGVK